uniref:Uncharacterized protein n=1 Tax=Oryza sativa subsp. japonica TaxID=39947 RepID=Q7F0Z9_ORYSJ|nr:hypothetical protein [Oryza sativa Japonica Group]BAD03435.1 hypothetical protein [Oryza sativa Japonica Group]
MAWQGRARQSDTQRSYSRWYFTSTGCYTTHASNNKCHGKIISLQLKQLVSIVHSHTNQNRGFIVRSAAQQRCVSTSHTEEELFAGLFSPPLPSCLATQFLVAARQLEGEEGGSAGS